jgi:hypothetical protein
MFTNTIKAAILCTLGILSFSCMTVKENRAKPESELLESNAVSLGAGISTDFVDGQRWSSDVPVKIRIFSNEGTLLKTIETEVMDKQSGWFYKQTNEVDVIPGMRIEARNDKYIKNLIVKDISIEKADTESGSITGKANPGDKIGININDGNAWLNPENSITTQEDGIWEFNLDGTIILKEGYIIQASVSDEDGDVTMYKKTIGN